MEVATTIEQVASHARAACASSGYLIGIDGFDGTGKTTLAFELAKQLDGIRVGLDSYVAKDQPADNYVGLLRAQHLERDLRNLLKHFPFVVVDGVCLVTALKAAGVSSDLLVYVKKISPQGLWHDGFHLENFMAGEPAGSWLAESVYGYHQSQLPHTQASVCYQWAGV